MAGISSKAASTKENKIKFGEKELQSKEFSDGSGLELYDFNARYLNPQIGRWHNLDPLADKAYSLTPYRYSFNNPMLFVDPDGRWEFQVGTKKKKDKDGNDTNETEKYLKLVKKEDGDNLTTLAQQTGIKLEILESLGLNLDKEITDLGSALKFSVINDALNYTDKECENMNNCWNASQELASGLQIGKDGKYSQLALEAAQADNNLTRYENIGEKDLRTGDYVRFARPYGTDTKQATEIGGTSHAVNFLLKNKKGMQVFTKNGSTATQYEISYTNEKVASLPGNKSILKYYGNPTGFKDPNTQILSTPYFRKK
jgi:RHS repeat-associated protein